MATKAVERPEASARIPSPPGLPVVGHLHRIARAGPIGHLLHVSRDFADGIFKLKFGSRVAVFVTDPDLVAERSSTASSPSAARTRTTERTCST